MRAWIAMAFAGEDNPYADEPRIAYGYDDRVQNHKQVRVGDLLFLRNRFCLEGIGRIRRIDEGAGKKIFRRCPECGSGRMHARKGRDLVWRCNSGHEFANPLEITQSVATFRALFAGDFLPISARIEVGELRPFELRDSRQLAMMPADIYGLSRYAARRDPTVASELIAWVQHRSVSLSDDDGNDFAELTPNGSDERELIFRGIRLRRGQKVFRDRLLDRYDGQCVISGCRVLGVLEAAHIRPYRGPRDNHPSNGLLLRSDLHTLFDLNRLAINPHTFAVALHSDLIGSDYEDLKGAPLRVTQHSAPDRNALTLRWQAFLPS